jgi:hypothetical protein
MFLLLPDTLRAAKVRRAHLGRIVLYGLAALPPVLVVPSTVLLLWAGAFNLCTALGWATHWLGRFPLREWQWSGLATLVSLWMIVWWSCAAGRYLRLPRPWLIGLVMAVVAWLAAALLVAALGNPMWLYRQM